MGGGAEEVDVPLEYFWGAGYQEADGHGKCQLLAMRQVHKEHYKEDKPEPENPSAAKDKPPVRGPSKDDRHPLAHLKDALIVPLGKAKALPQILLPEQRRASLNPVQRSQPASHLAAPRQVL